MPTDEHRLRVLRGLAKLHEVQDVFDGVFILQLDRETLQHHSIIADSECP